MVARPMRAISSLSNDEIWAILAGPAFPQHGSPTQIMVDGRPGLAMASDGRSSILFVRADDVVVSIDSAQFATAELVAFGAGLVATDIVPGPPLRPPPGEDSEESTSDTTPGLFIPVGTLPSTK